MQPETELRKRNIKVKGWVTIAWIVQST